MGSIIPPPTTLTIQTRTGWDSTRRGSRTVQRTAADQPKRKVAQRPRVGSIIPLLTPLTIQTRTGWDSNPRGREPTRFPIVRLKPLGHPSQLVWMAARIPTNRLPFQTLTQRPSAEGPGRNNISEASGFDRFRHEVENGGEHREPSPRMERSSQEASAAPWVRIPLSYASGFPDSWDTDPPARSTQHGGSGI